MKNHEFRMKDGSCRYGVISYVQDDTETAYVLTKDELGVLGQDGHPIPFADCQGIYAETTRPGVFDSEEQIAVWRRAWRGR